MTETSGEIPKIGVVGSPGGIFSTNSQDTPGIGEAGAE